MGFTNGLGQPKYRILLPQHCPFVPLGNTTCKTRISSMEPPGPEERRCQTHLLGLGGKSASPSGRSCIFTVRKITHSRSLKRLILAVMAPEFKPGPFGNRICLFQSDRFKEISTRVAASFTANSKRVASWLDWRCIIRKEIRVSEARSTSAPRVHADSATTRSCLLGYGDGDWKSPNSDRVTCTEFRTVTL